MRTDSKKLKLLYLMEVFRQNTDETHGLTLNEIAEKMNAWVFGLGKRIRIAAPQEAIDGMKKMLEDVASKHEE